MATCQLKQTILHHWWHITLLTGFLTLFFLLAQLQPAETSPAVEGAISEITIGDYFKASNPDQLDTFGMAVALDGNTLVVGAPNEDSHATGVNGNQTNNDASASGAVYIFVYEQGQWHQQAYLKASNTGIGDGFGMDVAISGDTIVVGAPFETSQATGVNGDQTDNSVFKAGAAYVFTRTNGVWSQQAYLKASNTGEEYIFGTRVAISGNTIVVTSPWEDSNATGVNGNGDNHLAPISGSAYVFTRINGVWSQQAYLKASNTEQLDTFGSSIAISGETIVVGATGEDSNTTGVNGDQTNNLALSAGAAYVFTRTAGQWSQQAYLKASNADSLGVGQGDNFGSAVAIDGSTIVVGAMEEDSGSTGVNGDQHNNSTNNAGAAYVFTHTNGLWSQQAYLKASNPGHVDYFGSMLNIKGDMVVVGAFGESSQATGVNGDQSDNSTISSGAAYLFTYTAGQWHQEAYLKPFHTNQGDAFALAHIGISDQFIAVGAQGEDSNAVGVNGNFMDNSLPNAGAVYTFQRPVSPHLTVSTVGAGQVTSDPAGISCGLICTTNLTAGTVVTLTATAEVGSTFLGWSGTITSTTNPITFTIETNQTIMATFAPEPSYPLFLPLIARPAAGGDRKE